MFKQIDIKSLKKGDEFKAFSTFDVGNVDADQMIIEGIASTPSLDRDGDVIDPLGAEYASEIPLLWQHSHGAPVGIARLGAATAEGIPFTAELANLDEEGELKRVISKAWQAVKSGLVRGVSIGFRVLDDMIEYAPEVGGWLFKSIEIYELSLVTIPANQDATIDVIKAHAESGASVAKFSKGKPGVTGKKSGATGVKIYTHNKGNTDMSKLQKTLAAYQKTKNAKIKEMDDLQDAAIDDGTTMTEEQLTQHSELEDEVKAIDAEIDRIQKRIDREAGTAQAVEGDDAQKGAKSRQPSTSPTRISHVRRNLATGTTMARYAIAMALCKGQLGSAAAFAENNVKSSNPWHDTPEVARIIKMQQLLGGKIDQKMIKAPVAPGTTVDPTFAEPLVDFTTMTSEFVSLLRPATIIGQMDGLRRIPFNTKINGQTVGGTANWVGEAKKKPVTRPGFNSVNHGFNKLAGIVVFSDELARWSDPAVEGIVINDLRDAITAKVNADFINKANAGVLNVAPAAITNGGAAPVTATGTSADDLDNDVNTILGRVATANIDVMGSYWIMNPLTALSIGSIKNALGQQVYPDLGISGGTFKGFPAITSTSVTAGDMVFVKAGEIYLSDDDGFAIDVSTEASVILSDDPEAATGAEANLVSLWQDNLVGVRVERYMNWSRRRNDAVQCITGANYS